MCVQQLFVSLFLQLVQIQVNLQYGRSTTTVMRKLQGLILLFWQGFVQLWTVKLRIYWNLCRKKIQKIVLHNPLISPRCAKRYESLDLTREQRIIINDYIACTSTVNHRYSDIAYMAGIKTSQNLYTYIIFLILYMSNTFY